MIHRPSIDRSMLRVGGWDWMGMGKLPRPSTTTSLSLSLSLSLSQAELDVLLFSTAFKFLLLPAYRSTDFEVHRNWLAITYSLPLSEWYYEETSPWTLDYPPFFGYFESLLARAAARLDPGILQLLPLGYQQWPCVLFQRTSVIITEWVLGAALLKLTRTRTSTRNSAPLEPHHSSTTALATAACLFLHPGLIIVDHIHFQYNGFLLGVLLWSIWAAREERFCLSAFLFTSLLNLKHIFVYLAPPFLVYLFRAYCTQNNQNNKRINPSSNSWLLSIINLIKLASIVLGTCAASFGPFFFYSGWHGLLQIITRLFPFQRGLNHAYWAGNFWALYSTLDRVLLKYQLSRGASFDASVVNSTSRGLVGDTVFGVLPTITPGVCLGVTLGFMAVVMTKLWQDPTYPRFQTSIVLAAKTSFLFGWHVHEKAALLFLLPLTLLAVDDYYHFRTWLVASSAGISGLFPLLIRPEETPIKLIYTFLWIGVCSTLLKRNLHRPAVTNATLLLTKLENSYLAGLFCLHIYVSVVHEFIVMSLPKDRSSLSSFAFLPLLVVSAYTAVGILWAFLRLLYGFFIFV